MVEGDVGLRLHAMEAALRCPVNNQKWKTAMLTRCSHAFSKRALLDTLNNRNRKCPTCKTPFSKGKAVELMRCQCLIFGFFVDDIVPLFLYQANSDDED